MIKESPGCASCTGATRFSVAFEISSRCYHRLGRLVFKKAKALLRRKKVIDGFPNSLYKIECLKCVDLVLFVRKDFERGNVVFV